MNNWKPSAFQACNFGIYFPLIGFLQSGVSEVIYFVEKRLENSDVAYIASHKLLSLAGVKVSLTFHYVFNFTQFSLASGYLLL